MKKIWLVFALALLCLTANAQVENLDEVELLGTWNVTDAAGIFNNAQYPVYNNERKRPTAITFADNANSYIAWQFASGIENQYYPGYWITHTSNRYILHMATRLGYDGYTSLSLLNFVVTRFGDGMMSLQTLTGDGTLHLTKDTSAGVSAARMDAPANSKAYDLNGVELPTPDAAEGIVIQGGKKILK